VARRKYQERSAEPYRRPYHQTMDPVHPSSGIGGRASRAEARDPVQTKEVAEKVPMRPEMLQMIEA